MGASWSVTFVSVDGKEFAIPVDVLSSASPVWRERFTLAGQFDKSARSEEQQSAAQVDAFLQVILTTQSHEATMAPSDLPLETLLLAMPLVHKYDCDGVKRMMVAMNSSLHFTESIVPKEIVPATGHRWLNISRMKQSHIDYMMLGQELYGPDFLNAHMKKVLAVLLTFNSKQVQGKHLIVEHTEQNGQEGAATMTALTLPAWRLTVASFVSLLSELRAKGFNGA